MRSIKSMKWTAIAVALFVLPVAQQPADDALKAQLLASPPATDTPTVEGKMNERTALACANVKGAGIKVYTVAFTGSTGINATTQDMLKACASDPSMYYLAADQTALLAAFQAIGDNISLLRISQ